ncbi:flagellar basal body rod protein FlgC [Pseudoduganella namucuonensis]|uniref:Flagellar basal-body rod protein FlgC n=1 Tax=Pseudoduganella namucuonensis TaxID=1035707 RepID=A0A1I7M402_9BURK|nr:flagellar basal body rod protein FlgC [Pseudoduganella namucuonensis]SFV16658.1 flagellar basal-body rod protein FlgC [Pseudoduganella namucuonensis]
MDYHAAFQISASGMAVEKLRLDVTAANIANMNSAAASADQVYRPLRVLAQAAPLSFGQQFGQLYGAVAGGGVDVLGVAPEAAAPRMVHEPGHPYADAKGMVAYPGVNHTQEMVNMSTALRAYEANVAAMNAAKTMAARALEIGGQQ